MTNDDHLANEIAVSAKLEDRGITASARSRALAATDRLLGSAADIPTAYLENIAAKARLRGEIERKRLIEVEARQHVGGLDEGREYLQAKMEEDEAKRIENLSKVVEAAIELLDEGGEFVASSDEEIDPDWLNRFKSYAGGVSTEEMQSLWARVLAGEVREPSRFSLSTLRFLSEVDRKVAETFQGKANLVLGGKFIPRPKKMAGAILSEYGLMEEADLLRDVNGFIGTDKEPDSDGRIYVREGNLLLIIESRSKQRLGLIPLTRIGKELLSILPKPDPLAALQAAFASIDSEAITAARIAVILDELPDGQVRYSDMTVLKS